MSRSFQSKTKELATVKVAKEFQRKDKLKTKKGQAAKRARPLKSIWDAEIYRFLVVIFLFPLRSYNQ